MEKWQLVMEAYHMERKAIAITNALLLLVLKKRYKTNQANKSTEHYVPRLGGRNKSPGRQDFCAKISDNPRTPHLDNNEPRGASELHLAPARLAA